MNLSFKFAPFAYRTEYANKQLEIIKMNAHGFEI